MPLLGQNMGRNVNGKGDERAVIPTTKWFGTPNHFESSIYSREKVWALPNLFGSGIGTQCVRPPKDHSALMIIEPQH